MAVRVLLVMGTQRSGSTLLATALGMVPGAWMAGELPLIWTSAVQGRPCTCLRRCTDCPVWIEVLSRTLEDPAVAGRSPADLSALMRTQARIRKLPLLLARSEPPASGDLAVLAAATRSLYESLVATSGADVIVDSSKSPAVVGFLRRVPGIDLRVVHLVRDPRGVGDSWSRNKAWTQDGWDEALYRKPLARVTGGWMWVNGLAGAVRSVLGPDRTPRVRFEDFLARPEPVLRSLVDLAGLPQPSAADLPLRDGAAIVQEHHAIAGNVDRFQVGPVPLRTDESWRQRLSPGRQRAVAATTLPLMRRYGYS